MSVTLEALALVPQRQTVRISSRTEQELLRLLVLRELEDAGPLVGLDVLVSILGRIAPRHPRA
jgi:hypothetical protein